MLIRFIFILSFMSLAACGPRNTSRPILNSKANHQTTGFEKESENGASAAYTISGNPEVYRQLRDQFEGKSPALARSIKQVAVKKIETDQYQIRVEFNDGYFGLKQLIFKGAVAAVGTEKHALLSQPEKTPSSFKSGFSLSIRCRSLDCQMMEMTLNESSGAYFKAEAVWIYQEKKTNTRFIDSDSGGISDLKVKLNETVSSQTSVVIVDGPSYSEVLVSAKSAQAEDEPLLRVRTDLVDTQEHAEVVQSVSIRGETQNYSAQLQGNDPNTGDLMLDIINKSGKKSRVIVSGPTSNNRKLQRTHTIQANSYLNPEGISDEVDAFTAGLNEYADHPEVLKRLNYWTGKSSQCKGCTRVLANPNISDFLSNIPAVAPEVMEASVTQNVSPEIIYQTWAESSFLKGDTFRIEVSSKSNSTAAGPWQIQTGTAKEAVTKGELPFQVFPLRGSSKKTLHPQDARNYFFESTMMAFNHYSRFPKAIQHDPGLQFIGYYYGHNLIARYIKNHGDFRMGFTELARLNSFKNSKNAEDYVYSIIALRFIGMNDEAHEMNISELTEVPAALRGKLRRSRP